MKKILLMLTVVGCSLMAHAADYPYLVFTNTEDVNTILSISNMTLTVSGNQLIVTNAEGTESFVLTDLKSMQFSADGSVTALDNVINTEAEMEVYTLTGVRLGRFDNLEDARRQIGQGTYLISDGKNTQKIVIQ